MIRRRPVVVQRPIGIVRRLVRWPFHHPLGAVCVLGALKLIAERGL